MHSASKITDVESLHYCRHLAVYPKDWKDHKGLYSETLVVISTSISIETSRSADQAHSTGEAIASTAIGCYLL
jgi:hypothetical protein